MPSSEKQRRAAAVELGKRKRGIKKQKKGKRTRPFGTATLKTLKDFVKSPITSGDRG